MPPANDFIGNATVITLPASFSYDTTGCALGGSGNPIDDDFPYPDVWYRIEPAVDVGIGITVEQTGGPATDGPEVDLYHLIGSDPPTAWTDLQSMDWAGDGTVGPTSGWQNGPTTSRTLYAGEVYYLDAADWNFTDEIVTSVILTALPPVVNDDWEHAIVIDQTGGNTLQVSTVGASGAQQGSSETEDDFPTVWYRIECPDDGHVSLSVLNSSDYRIEAGYRHNLDVYGPVTDPVTDLDEILTATHVGAIQDTGPHSNHPPYDDTGGWEPWLLEWLCSAGEIYYVQASNNSQFGDPVEGTFTMRVTLREWTTFDAAPGINNGSATTSIVDTDWVKDTQYREIDITGATYKGTLDFTKTFEIEPGLTGKYEVQVYGRFKSPTDQTGHQVQCIMRVNDIPVRVGYPLFESVNDNEQWWNLTQEYMVIDDGGYGFSLNPGLATACKGGQRYIQLQAGDVVSFDIGDDNYYDSIGPFVAPDRTFEVQKVRFSPASAYDPLPSWNTVKHEFETFEFNDYSNFMAASHGTKLYMFHDGLYYTSVDALSWTPFLNVLEYELVDGRMEAVNGDLPIDGSNPPADLAVNRGGSFDSILMKDICVLDSGDIYVLWTEYAGGSGYGNDWYLVLKRWDGVSWTLVSDDVPGHGAPTPDYLYSTPDMDTDGTDIWITWGENRTAGTSADGFWWRCKKYDVSGDTLTELGSGQTAYPGATGPTNVGDFDHRMRVRASPAGIPYVLFEEFDPDEADPADTHFYLWRWDGAAWEDMELPYPNPTPDPIGDTNASTFAPGNGNYGSATEDIFIPQDIVFCHHDGPSETPAIIHNYWWQGVGEFSGQGQLGDVGTWFYAECDGIGDWHNEMLIIEGGQPEQAPTSIVYANEYPNRFPHSTSDFDGNSWIPWGGGWCQGMKLVIFHDRPTFINTLGYFGSGTDCVYIAQVNAAGTSWNLLGNRFPTDLYSADISGFAWSDMGEPGCVVDGKIVCYWEDQSAFGFTGYFMTVFTPGGVVSMHWRVGEETLTTEKITNR